MALELLAAIHRKAIAYMMKKGWVSLIGKRHGFDQSLLSSGRRHNPLRRQVVGRGGKTR